jgi:hypothetical protein
MSFANISKAFPHPNLRRHAHNNVPQQYIAISFIYSNITFNLWNEVML